MLRNRLETGFVSDSAVLALSRLELATSGLVVAEVTARAVEPLPGTYAGITVRLDGPEPRDRAAPGDPATDPLSPGLLGYDFYSLEVVQRIGYDSYTPDGGVLIAKNRDSLRGRNGGPNEFNSFIWVIDAHPEDIGEVDYVAPDGRDVVRTVADYRQLNDALFHAGLDSGSRTEWVDEANRLHFYVVDVREDARGVRGYRVAVRSLDGPGSVERGVALDAPADAPARMPRGHVPVTFTVRNTGGAADVYRLAATADDEGWSARLLNELAAVQPGDSARVSVFVARGEGAGRSATVTLRATSESDPSGTAEASLQVRR
jgi:hypothetical protein